jgi:enoyl-[acyl-carrier-protein] reductase (NADH)
MALGKSCLLAKTRRIASRSSSSLSIRWSSSRASPIRSRSLESTTKMIPCVFWKSVKFSDIRHPTKMLEPWSTRRWIRNCAYEDTHSVATMVWFCLDLRRPKR